MIQFDILKVSSEGKYLTIKASVIDISYYENVFIDSIIIDNQDTYSPLGPSKTPLYKKSFTENSTQSTPRSVDLTVSAKELGGSITLNNDVLYIYVIAGGTPAEDTPCGMDNMTTLGVAINLKYIYNTGINYVRQIEETCEPPKEFIDFILRYKAFELALKIENYTQANKYWNKFFKNKTTKLITNSCGCS